jgi:membrane protease YdiL (CAAX protease family)
MNRWHLARHPWLAVLTFVLVHVLVLTLASVLLIGILSLRSDAPLTQFLLPALAHAIVLFGIVPFVLRLPAGKRSFRAYLDEIRLTHVQPLLQLVLLSLSCYLILALSQVAGVLVYRAAQGGPVTWAFVRGILDLSGDLPPRSWSLLTSLPSALEEVAFRGVVLSLFLTRYRKPVSIALAAFSFGAIHLLNVVGGREWAWVLGQVAWASILGLFYGYVVLKTDSLLPAMLLHYLGNLVVGSLTSYLQSSASIQTQALYGLIFTFGLLPTGLMLLWVKAFLNIWPIPHLHRAPIMDHDAEMGAGPAMP